MIDFSELFQNWSQGILVLSGSNELIFANEEATNITGYTTDQLIDTSLNALFSGSGSSIKESNPTSQIDFLLEHPGETIPQYWLGQGGEFIELEAKCLVIELETQTVKVVCFEEFEDSEQSIFYIRKLAAFPSLIPLPLIQIDVDGNIEYSNEPFNDLMLEFGFSNMGDAAALPKNWRNQLEQCFETGNPRKTDPHKVQSQFFTWSFYPVLEQSIPFVIGVGQNVTDQLSYQRSLESINRMHVENNKQKNKFLTTLNAEMQTPLNEIETHLRLLQHAQLEDAQNEWIRNIQFASKVLSGLVYDSEDRLKLESNSLILRNRAFNPSLLVAQVLEMLAPKINAKALKYYLTIDPEVPQKIEGDSKRLGTVLRILLNNAIDYTDRGGIVLKMHQSKNENYQNCLRFSIADTGAGLKEGMLDKVFSSNANFGNSLPAAKKILDLMGGNIGVQSVPGRGSLFFIEIPCSVLEGRANISLNMSATAIVNFTEKIWNTTIESYLVFAGVNVVEDSGCDFYFGDKPSQVASKHRILISQMPSTDEYWEFQLPPHSPPSYFFDLLSALTSGDNETTVSQLEQKSEQKSIDLEPLGLTVLLIDDSRKNLTVFEEVVESLGCQVISAQSSDEAITEWFMSGGTINLILLDCKMPDVDGYQTAALLRGENYDGPIIGMTTRRYEDEIEAVMHSGMTSCITKPLDAEDLHSLIMDLL